ncbi:uncharacterized protein LOC130767856 isoform X2 [Actinidia eriantha]|uniref:uncharacterized protein LOC130767856 isoform X2 n=1 Tax=Actinidia eriantha TaxID=165200 RepID=UPI00258E6EE4|nr:uncharacterized protein LOC130767856 isoform X2 [Actinidia eriantha]XP_057480885.1 uncharacterized protein LOC130767856 isoform X2 [Actinidia eriantha]XP_057480886.1 uncharacterized protein LOC130767856 isoform X2 [Actinidia eriantha]
MSLTIVIFAVISLIWWLTFTSDFPVSTTGFVIVWITLVIHCKNDFKYVLAGERRNQDGYDFALFSDDEEENKYFRDEYTDRDHLVADIISGGEALQFLPTGNPRNDLCCDEAEATYEEPEEDFRSPASESEFEGEDDIEGEIPETEDTDSAFNSDTNDCGDTTQLTMNQDKSGLVADDETLEEKRGHEGTENKNAQLNFTHDENFLSFAPPKLETKKFQVQGKDINEEIFGDTYTVGSTSKSSSEWRSSINCRDSGTEDPFSSSSRRSCPKWESYTVFQKYDEEMLFLDRISAQKLHETESLRSIQACPRSISERIVHKLATRNRNKSASDIRRNPYYELEAAYVAQICLTWEALNWNYNYYQRLRALRCELDPGCPAYVTQQFQQFQVLLQRYVENEPYEHGRRPEIYARMRSLAPKLLQVPEYRDSNHEEEERLGSRIASDSFLLIMEESIRTFMNFLKADRESHSQILASFFRKNRRDSVDPTRLLFLKKLNKMKKLKLNDVRRSGKCLRKRRLKKEEEMEILMALIDTKVVSRVLRMTGLSEEQLQWCDDKMSKVRVHADGKLQRDSSPLFFPAH